jgi:hypothetical protein
MVARSPRQSDLRSSAAGAADRRRVALPATCALLHARWRGPIASDVVQRQKFGRLALLVATRCIKDASGTRQVASSVSTPAIATRWSARRTSASNWTSLGSSSAIQRSSARSAPGATFRRSRSHSEIARSGDVSLPGVPRLPVSPRLEQPHRDAALFLRDLAGVVAVQGGGEGPPCCHGKPHFLDGHRRHRLHRGSGLVQSVFRSPARPTVWVPPREGSCAAPPSEKRSTLSHMGIPRGGGPTMRVAASDPPTIPAIRPLLQNGLTRLPVS